MPSDSEGVKPAFGRCLRADLCTSLSPGGPRWAGIRGHRAGSDQGKPSAPRWGWRGLQGTKCQDARHSAVRNFCLALACVALTLAPRIREGRAWGRRPDPAGSTGFPNANGCH